MTQFGDWIRMHQATGVEADEIAEAFDTPEQSSYLPPIQAEFASGTLQFSPELLRTVLITAAQREIQLIASAANEGISQTARMRHG